MNAPACPRCGAPATPDHGCAADRSAARAPSSFVEQYRGTEWDSAPPTAELPSDPAQRRPPMRVGYRLMMVGALLLVAALLGGSAYALYTGASRPRPGQLLLPYDGPQSTAGPTVQPTGAAGVPSTGPTSETPAAAWRSEPAHPASRMVKWLSADALAYEVTVEGVISAYGDVGSMGYSLLVSNQDFDQRLTLANGTASVRSAFVAAAGSWYTRSGGDGWLRRTEAPPTVALFGQLEPGWADRLEYLGDGEHAGAWLFHVRLEAAGWPQPMGETVLPGHAGPRQTVWDVWVDTDGRPRAAEATLVATPERDGSQTRVSVRLSCTFSAFGEAVTIEPPRRYRDL